MKTIRKIYLISLSVLTVMIVFCSCSKERTETSEYEPLDEFYDNNAPEEQTFIIDSIPGDTIVGIHGTKIWGVPKTIFMYKSTQQDIYYPFFIKLIEAYSIKDMILSKLPNVAQGNILKSDGELKVTAFKNNDELVLKEHCGLNMWAPSSNPDDTMGVYYGFTNATTDDWNIDVTQTDYLFTQDTVTKIGVLGKGYGMKIAKLGWLSVCKLNTFTSTSGITFTAVGTNTNFIDIFIVFNNLHSYIKVNNLTVSNLPVGEPVTVFAIAKDTDASMYYFKQNYTISTSSIIIDLVMQKSTEAEVLTLMGSL
ncbi:MAG TPA: hypothetical protein PKK00_03380 [Bacteroidales bacterium]|nr:hypothetical protein [Bacteroidales bacterium]HPS16453.1 hypothetical protein [Bacteroidales bacterium]